MGGDSDKADIVVAGAINTDLVAVVERAPQAGETVTGSSFSIFSGGKGANQAIAAQRSGSLTAMVGAVGDDAFGMDRRADLAADGIIVDGITEFAGMASGVALITVEREGENRIAYVPGPTLRVTGEQIRGALEAHRPAIYLQPNEVPSEVAAVAIRTARELGASTVLNAAPDPTTVWPVLPDVQYLIVNEVEAFALVDESGPLDEIAIDLARRSGTNVVLTAGAVGAYGVEDGEVFHVAAPAVQVVDTTGAGDTFCGAFAACLAHGVPFGEAVAWSVVAGSLATTISGAQPSIPRREVVEGFITDSR